MTSIPARAAEWATTDAARRSADRPRTLGTGTRPERYYPIGARLPRRFPPEV